VTKPLIGLLKMPGLKRWPQLVPSDPNLASTGKLSHMKNFDDSSYRATTLVPMVVEQTSRGERAYDAMEVDRHQAFADAVFAGGPLDMVISAAGLLVPQEEAERDVRRAAEMVETNFTGHVTSLLAVAAGMRAQGHGTIVVLSSVAAVRPRKANFVYGSAKAGLDAFARGLTDSLHGTGVRVLLVRPGFVTGRMTAGMPPAPLATTPERVGAATAAALRRRKAVVWIPAPLAGLALALRLVPRPLWRRVSR